MRLLHQSETERAFLFITVITTLLALAIQLYVTVSDTGLSVGLATTRYFGYFAIWVNLAVFICCLNLSVQSGGIVYRFFANPAVQTAIAIYITAAAVVYNTVLRTEQNSEGMQRVADELLHLVVPLLFLVYWIFFTSKTGLRLKHILLWSVFPILYLSYIFSAGNFSGYYPYPYVDVTNLGFRKVSMNCLILVSGLIGLSGIFIGIARLISEVSIRKR